MGNNANVSAPEASPQTKPPATATNAPVIAITRNDHKGVFLCGLSEPARIAGLQPGMRLAEARSILPDLVNLAEDPDLYQRHLDRLIRKMDRYSPWVAPDRSLLADSLTGDGGLWLEMTGGIHLFGGEEALLDLICADIRACGFACRTALADTAGAAWASARFHPGNGILSLPLDRETARDFPVEGLRLMPDTLAILHRLGLSHLRDLAELPRATLTTRLGPEVLERFDQFYGHLPEHLDFHLPDRPWLVRQGYGEPLGDADNLHRAISGLLDGLCQKLQAENLGLRRLVVRCGRVDGHTHTLGITTGTPCRSVAHIMRLLGEKLPGVDTGFGIEEIIVYAPWVEPIAFRQADLDHVQSPASNNVALAELLDRIAHHLGPEDHLFRPQRHASHLPEKAVTRHPVSQATTDRRTSHDAGASPLPLRPVRLIDPPEPADVTLPTQTGKGAQLRWRRIEAGIVDIIGPERICPEWWENLGQPGFGLGAQTRDYFRIHDTAGRHLWLCRQGNGAHDLWSVHGMFA